MANVLCIQASPRKTGYTAKLLDKAVEGIKIVNNVDVIHFQLIDFFPIHPCKSCWACVKNHSCVHDDSMGKLGKGELFQKIGKANALLISHPVYYGRPTSGLNLFLLVLG